MGTLSLDHFLNPFSSDQFSFKTVGRSGRLRSTDQAATGDKSCRVGVPSGDSSGDIRSAGNDIGDDGAATARLSTSILCRASFCRFRRSRCAAARFFDRDPISHSNVNNNNKVQKL